MRLAGGLGVLVALLAVGAGCSDRASGTQRAAPPAVPVLVADAVRRDVPLDVGVIGTVQALTTVGVKSQVSGQVIKVNFTEGQDVKAGQLLFTIDPRPYEAALAQAQANVGRDTAQLRQAEAAYAQRQAEVQQVIANLERDQAQLENARVQEKRYKTLVDKEMVAREQYDQFRTNLSALEATLNADRAAVDNARAVIRADEAFVETVKLNLDYTTIRAPMEGRTGNLMLQAGNVVKANDDNPMVVIAQIHPIYVSFAVPQQHLATIKQYNAAGPLTVRAAPPGAAKPTIGRLTFVNNTVDPTTGTIQLKGTFDNADNVLWPGQYVEVVLTLTMESAVVVPSQAVQPGQQGPYVFVVKPDSTVQPRPVDLGRRLATETIVTKGLAAGERVVTDGQLRLVPGARVEIKPQKTS
jgi:membrane fusion protein, multidrug efflux system